MFNKKNNNKGFTLMEMLIVVAIIAILIAIAIPTFSATLEKARESTDAANIRAKYSELASEAVTGNTTAKGTVKITQSDLATWKNADLKTTVIGAKHGELTTNVVLGDICSLTLTDNTLHIAVYPDGSCLVDNAVITVS